MRKFTVITYILVLAISQFGMLASTPNPARLSPLEAVYNVPYFIWGTKGIAEDREAWRRCTTAVSWTKDSANTRDFILAWGVIAEHCVGESKKFIPREFYIIHPHSRERIEAQVTGYKPSNDKDNEVRLWRARIPSSWGIRRQDAIVSQGQLGDVFYYCAFWPTRQYYEKVCTEGKTLAPWPRGPYESSLTGEILGDIIMTGPAYWGFSGAPVYADRGGQLVLVGMVNAFSLFSNMVFAWAVPLDIMTWVGNVSEVESGSPQTVQVEYYPKNYGSWNDEDKALWQEALDRNASYSISYSYESSQWVLSVMGIRYVFLNELDLVREIVYNRLPLKGVMLNVKWNMFELRRK